MLTKLLCPYNNYYHCSHPIIWILEAGWQVLEVSDEFPDCIGRVTVEGGAPLAQMLLHCYQSCSDCHYWFRIWRDMAIRVRWRER